MTRYMTSKELSEATDVALDLAASEAVVIADEGRERAVLVSPEDYRALHRTKTARLREAFDNVALSVGAAGMSDAELQVIVDDVT